MAGEKYIVATSDNQLQISVRNILNPGGYMYLGTCNEIFSLSRQITSVAPDFVVIDSGFNFKDVRQIVETIDQHMSCACVILGDMKDNKIIDLLEVSKSVIVSPRPPTRELLLYGVEMGLISFKRMHSINTKLNEVTANFDTRKFVERAKGILMERDKISEDEAYCRMRKKSMDARMTMKAVSEAIIANIDYLK